MKLNTRLMVDLQVLSDGTPVPLTPREMAENLIGLCLGIGAGYKWESNKSFIIKLNPAIPEHRELLPRLTKPIRTVEREENWRGRKITVRDTTTLAVKAH